VRAEGTVVSNGIVGLRECARTDGADQAVASWTSAGRRLVTRPRGRRPDRRLIHPPPPIAPRTGKLGQTMAGHTLGTRDRRAEYNGACVLRRGAYDGDSQWFWFEGNFKSYEVSKIDRLGPEASDPGDLSQAHPRLDNEQ